MNRQLSFNVVIVGAGPAGLAAAAAASAAGAPGLRIALIDDNPFAGGQIWRGGAQQSGDPRAVALWQTLTSDPDVSVLSGTRICAPLGANRLLAEGPQGWLTLDYERLILATGARERLLPFPGWTLPGVSGAGGLQALCKSGYPVRGKRVVVAGTGPLLLAVAASLKSAGAQVLAILEQARPTQLARFGAGLLRTPSKLVQAWHLRAELSGIPYLCDSFVLAAEGEDRLAQVRYRRGRRTHVIECDYLACGYGLVPNTELAAALGCAVTDRAVRVDAVQATSVPGIFCAGEGTGIGGVDRALAEGRIAGLAASGASATRSCTHERSRWHRFAALLEQCFVLRDELRMLCAPDTIVCRCEDVCHAQLAPHDGWRSAKLHTRCGMGACQGRVCGTAAAFLYGWTNTSVRAPIAPVRVATLAQHTAGSRQVDLVNAVSTAPDTR